MLHRLARFYFSLLCGHEDEDANEISNVDVGGEFETPPRSPESSPQQLEPSWVPNAEEIKPHTVATFGEIEEIADLEAQMHEEQRRQAENERKRKEKEEMEDQFRLQLDMKRKIERNKAEQAEADRHSRQQVFAERRKREEETKKQEEEKIKEETQRRRAIEAARKRLQPPIVPLVATRAS
jgi:type IV secretory pathway VirB10-like protein